MGRGNSKPQAFTNKHEEYIESFKLIQGSLENASKLLHEVPRFGENIIKLFPQCTTSYAKYTEMVQFLRRYDPQMQNNLQVKAIAKNTSIVDRFFMICLGIFNLQNYNQKTLNFDETEELLMDCMRIFVSQPKKGYLQKVLQYIRMKQDKDKISLKQFGERLRQDLPYIQDFLKNYYKLKFQRSEKNVQLLKDMKSQVLQDDAIILALKIPSMVSGHTTLLYSSHKNGLGFHSIQRKILGYTGPWLLLITHTEKNNQGQRIEYKFGSYQNGPIKDTNVIQGDLTGFMFTIQPKIKFYTTDKGQGGKNYFFINNINQQISKKRKGIGFGGDNNREQCKLWIDQDLDRSKVFNGNDKTYGFGVLANHATQILAIRNIQIWGLGNVQNLAQQQQYWIQRQAEIMKRRKVNKKEFVDGNAGMFMANTFAHRDQVIGDIDWQRKDKK